MLTFCNIIKEQLFYACVIIMLHVIVLESELNFIIFDSNIIDNKELYYELYNDCVYI